MGYSGSFPHTNTRNQATPGIQVNNTAFSGNVVNAGFISKSGISVTNSTINGSIVDSGTLAGGITVDDTSKITAGNSGTAIDVTGAIFGGGIHNAGTVQAGSNGIAVGGATTGHGRFAVSIFSGGIINTGAISVTSGADITVSDVSTFAGGVTNNGTVNVSAGAGIVVDEVSTFFGGVSNAGTINAAPSGDGIDVNNVSTFFGGITNTGEISAGTGNHGIYVGSAGEFFGGVNNAGTIQVESDGAGIQVGASSGSADSVSHFAGGIANSGTISGATGALGIYVVDVSTLAGDIVNSGSITAVSDVGILVDSVSHLQGDIINTGTISGGTAIQVMDSGSVNVFDTGTLVGTDGTAVDLSGNAALSSFTLGSGYSITGDVIGNGSDSLKLGGTGNGSFDLSDVGTQYTGFSHLDVIGGVWTTTGTGSGWNVENGTFRVSGTADNTVISGGTVEVTSGGSLGSSVHFAADTSVLQIDGSPAGNLLPGTIISGFAPGDTIDLAAIKFTSGAHADMNYTTDVLTITDGGTVHTLDFGGNLSGEFFHLAADSSGNGTVITENGTPCYCPGTLIFTEDGERPVETLSIGDKVMTAWGVLRPIKWIGRRSYGGRFVGGRKDILPVCIKAGALSDNVPARDLWISPHHAMYFDNEGGGTLIEAKDLINGVSIVQAESVDKVDYFHVELDTHDVIIAEGALSETFIDDDSRHMFHNAHEYAARYADAAAAPACYCAPRIDEGYAVEKVRRSIAQRAGLFGGDGQRPGVLRGFVDEISATCITGWAQNAEAPEAPVCLDVHAGDRLIERVVANVYRKDLERAGLGSGRHSFTVTLPNDVDIDTVSVRRSLDGAALSLSLEAQQLRGCRAA